MKILTAIATSMLWLLSSFSATTATATSFIRDDGPSEYRQAIDLIQAYSGGDELERSAEIARQLAAQYPKGGYSEALQAETVSTWQVDPFDGKPAEAVTESIRLAEEAKRLNPGLTLPYVSKARALTRSSQYAAAAAEIDAVLAMEPDMPGAIFLKADVMRRVGRFDESEREYEKFIAKVVSPARKSNGYNWMAYSYLAAIQYHRGDAKANLAGARNAFQKSVELDPSAWKTANFAGFLNSMGEDYVAAETYARRALALSDMPIAHMQLAMALYQQLLGSSNLQSQPRLKADVERIGAETGYSLEDLTSSGEMAESTQARLVALRARL
jgi:tetratricopeptide (TPR) repeat protein